MANNDKKVGMDAADSAQSQSTQDQSPPPQQSSFDMAIGYFKLAFEKYADFSGRANRREYWYFILVSFLINALISIIDSMFLTRSVFYLYGGSLLSSVYSIVVFIPSLAVAVRRLHDRNMSGWLLLLLLLPIIGFVVLIFILAQRGDPKENQYGPMSKA